MAEPTVQLKGAEPVVYHGVFRKPGSAKIFEKCQPMMQELRLHKDTGEIDMHNMERPPCCMPRGGCFGTGVAEKTAWATQMTSITVVGREKGCLAPLGPCYNTCVMCYGGEPIDCGGRAGLYIVGPSTSWTFMDTRSFFIPIEIENARKARDDLKEMRLTMDLQAKQKAYRDAVKLVNKPAPARQIER